MWMGGNFDAYKVSKYLMGKNDALTTINDELTDYHTPIQQILLCNYW